MSFNPENPNGQALSANSSAVVLSTEQEAILSAIKTAVEVLDNFISGTKGLVTEDNSAAIKTAVETIDNFISGSRGLVTEDNSAAIKTAVETLDNFISGARGLVTEDNSASIKTAVEALSTVTGAIADAAIAAGATGSVSAKLRLMTSQLDAIKTAVELIDNAISGAGFNITQLAGTAVAVNSGNKDNGTQRMVLATDQPNLTTPLNVAGAGDLAHDAVDSGNPVKIGAKALAHGANPAAVAGNDRTQLYANRHGIPFSIGGHPNIQSAEYITTGAQTNDNILPVISAGTIYVIVGITVAASKDNTVNTSVRIGFGASAVPTQGSSGADAVTKVVLSHPGLAPGSGMIKGNGAGIVGIGGDGEELRITNSAPTTGSIVVQVDYYTIES